VCRRFNLLLYSSLLALRRRVLAEAWPRPGHLVAKWRAHLAVSEVDINFLVRSRSRRPKKNVRINHAVGVGISQVSLFCCFGGAGVGSLLLRRNYIDSQSCFYLIQFPSLKITREVTRLQTPIHPFVEIYTCTTKSADLPTPMAVATCGHFAVLLPLYHISSALRCDYGS
jgi:hypothetical protein